MRTKIVYRLPWEKNDGNLTLGKPFGKSNMEQNNGHVYHLGSEW